MSARLAAVGAVPNPKSPAEAGSGVLGAWAISNRSRSLRRSAAGNRRSFSAGGAISSRPLPAFPHIAIARALSGSRRLETAAPFRQEGRFPVAHSPHSHTLLSLALSPEVGGWKPPLLSGRRGDFQSPTPRIPTHRYRSRSLRKSAAGNRRSSPAGGAISSRPLPAFPHIAIARAHSGGRRLETAAPFRQEGRFPVAHSPHSHTPAIAGAHSGGRRLETAAPFPQEGRFPVAHSPHSHTSLSLALTPEVGGWKPPLLSFR